MKTLYKEIKSFFYGMPDKHSFITDMFNLYYTISFVGDCVQSHFAVLIEKNVERVYCRIQFWSSYEQKIQSSSK